MDAYLIASLSVAAVTLLTIPVLLIKNKSLKKKNKLLVASLKQVQQLVDLARNNEKDNDVHQENFIKFLSDSRDWAYQYIEDVQDGLTSFVNAIEPEINYFDEYGLVGEAYPHYHSMQKISKEYKELKKLLPIEEE
jgi:hypothetical protein